MATLGDRLNPILIICSQSYIHPPPPPPHTHTHTHTHTHAHTLERALRLVYNDYYSSFQTLLIKDNSVSIHIRNIQALAIELYKVAKGISTEIMGLVFPLRESIRYPTMNIFQTRNVRTTAYRSQNMDYLTGCTEEPYVIEGI